MMRRVVVAAALALLIATSGSLVASGPLVSSGSLVASGFSRTFTPVPSADVQSVSFAARDGVTVFGSLHLPDRLPAPGVILLPMAGRTRQEWEDGARALAKAGIAALAIDFRRGGGPTGGDGSGQGESYADLVFDAEAARAYLSARPDIIASRIGMAGASLGANVAVLAAANDPTVRSLALLSVSLEYRGLKIEQPMVKFGSRPALLVSSSEDYYALRSARTLVTAGDGPRELRVLSDAGHGMVMVARHPELIDAVVDWFSRTL